MNDQGQMMTQITHLNWIDYTIVALLAASIVISLIRGFIREAFSLVTWIAAFLISFNFAEDLSTLFAGHIKSEKMSFIIAFAILFFSTLIIGAIINYLVSTLVHKTGLGGTDRVIGMALGGVRGVLVISILIILAGFTAIPKETAWQQSVLLPQFAPCVTWVEQYIPKALDFFTGK